ncbi:MAG: PEP-CTERM/exosortase system-associated acyltransferase [Burkholderiales bacterium]|nr:PEP-CTERM/exosortase system-associated acyltransferase [Burkholderiales bacterium]
MAWFDAYNLGRGFKRYFEVAPALSEELKDAVYGIRHRVYCEELGFEPIRADRREKDEYDAHSVHLLMRSFADDGYIGCSRLVLARPGDPYYPLPFERTCSATLDRSIADPTSMPRSAVAEVSRLAIVNTFRRRRGEQGTADALAQMHFGSRDRPRFPYIQVGLYLGIVALAQRLRIETLFVLTEPRLENHFRKLGVTLRPVGAPVEHRGMRVPAMMNVSEVVEGLRFFVRPLYDVILDEIEASYPVQRTLH